VVPLPSCCRSWWDRQQLTDALQVFPGCTSKMVWDISEQNLSKIQQQLGGLTITIPSQFTSVTIALSGDRIEKATNNNTNIPAYLSNSGWDMRTFFHPYYYGHLYICTSLIFFHNSLYLFFLGTTRLDQSPGAVWQSLILLCNKGVTGYTKPNLAFYKNIREGWFSYVQGQHIINDYYFVG